MNINIYNLIKKFPTHSITYPDINALPGEHILVSGASGSGKTTLCEMIAKFIPRDSGIISIDGYDINTINVFEHLHYISQFPEHNLIGPTCYEEIELWLNFSTIIKTEKKNFIHNKLKEYFLGDSIEKPIWKLSFGQKKALTFCVLSIIPRKIWILDEPFAGLDEDMSDKIFKLFDEFLESAGIILSTTSNDCIETIHKLSNKSYFVQ